MNESRNWKIYFEWIEGKDYEELSNEFKLSKDTIKEICTSKVPAKIKSMPWQTANSYRKFRQWAKTHKSTNQRVDPTDRSAGPARVGR